MLHIHPKSQTCRSHPPSDFLVGCWPWWTPWTYSWYPLLDSSLSIYYWYSLCSCHHCLYIFYSLWNETMDLIFHHNFSITCPSCTSCHKFHHPCLSCCILISPHWLYLHLPVKTTILWMQEFLVQLSCCICPEDVDFYESTWGIGYLRWRSCSVDIP